MIIDDYTDRFVYIKCRVHVNMYAVLLLTYLKLITMQQFMMTKIN